MNARDGPPPTITRRPGRQQMRRWSRPIPGGNHCQSGSSPAAPRRAQLAWPQVRHRHGVVAIDRDQGLSPRQARVGPVVRAAIAAHDALDARPDLPRSGSTPARHSRRVPSVDGGLCQVLRGEPRVGGFGPLAGGVGTEAALSRGLGASRSSVSALGGRIDDEERQSDCDRREPTGPTRR